MRHRVLLSVFLIVTFNLCALAEQWPTNNVLFRVLYIKVGDFTGSAFTIERGDKQYLITARHMLEGLPRNDASIQINFQGKWETLNGNVILPEERDVDIAVFTLPRELTPKFEIELGKIVTIGEGGYFFGYPHGWHSEVDRQYVAFVKRASVSAVPKTKNGAHYFYLNGFNNPGFSGGPVAFYDYKSNQWAIVAVISGFEPEAAKKLVGQSYVDADEMLVNSGVIVAFPIQPALDALDKYIAEKR